MYDIDSWHETDAKIPQSNYLIAEKQSWTV